MNELYSVEQVYEACLLASSRGINCGDFLLVRLQPYTGNFKSPFYQLIASRFYTEAKALGHEKVVELFCSSCSEV